LWLIKITIFWLIIGFIIPPANNRILSGECCGGDVYRGCNALFLIFFFIIDFIEFTVFVNALFYRIVVAVYVDMEILV
jgi:hypothetical protein